MKGTAPNTGRTLEWQATTLGAEIDLLAGFAFKSGGYTKSGEAVRLLRGDNIVQGAIRWDDVKKWPASDAGDYARYALNEGDVVLAMDRPWVKAGLKHAMIAAADLPCLLVQRTARLRCRERLDNRYLMHLLRTDAFIRHILGVQTGIGVPHISGQQISDFQFKRPPLHEQRRIVALLDEAFAGIAAARANAEKNCQNARALFESELQAVFSRGSDGVAPRRLDSVCDDITVGHVGTMAKRYQATGIPFLRPQNIRPFQVDLQNLVFIDDVFHESLAKSQLRPGDLAIVRTGYPGTAAVIPETLPIANCSDLVIVRPGSEIDAHYLALFFNSQHGQRLISGRLVGAAQKHFNVTAAKEVMLALPQKPEQQAVVSAMHSLRTETQRLESLYQRKLAALDELKRSLLHRAFTGQL